MSRIEEQIADICRKQIERHEQKHHKGQETERRTCVPDSSRPHSRATVYDGGEPSEYTFYGLPNVMRVILETKLGKPGGAQLVVVESNKGFGPITNAGISKKQAYFSERIKDVTKLGWHTVNNIYSWHITNSDEEEDLRTLIAAVKPKEPEWTPQVGDVIVGRNTNKSAVITKIRDGRSSILGRYKDERSLWGGKKDFRKATPDEALDLFTITGEEDERAVFYWDEDSDIQVMLADGSIFLLVINARSRREKIITNVFLHYFNLTPDSPFIVPVKARQRLFNGEYRAPKPKGD